MNWAGDIKLSRTPIRPVRGDELGVLPENEKLFGFSLSRCVRDILDGHVTAARVSGMIFNTRITNAEEFFSVLEYYARAYWSRYDAAEIQAVLVELFGKPWHQPRVFNQTSWGEGLVKIYANQWGVVWEKNKA